MVIQYLLDSLKFVLIKLFKFLELWLLSLDTEYLFISAPVAFWDGSQATGFESFQFLYIYTSVVIPSLKSYGFRYSFLLESG